MTPFADTRRTRPVASARVEQVDGGMWQARCVCRWHSRRYPNRLVADIAAARHVAACGICVLLGRDYMDRCSCANCDRRRVLTRQWAAEQENAGP